MIGFATLFLGLTLGIHPVEAVVAESVVAVEFFLDGRSIGVRKEAPWRTPCDFGERLLPHELVIVGRDREGKEVGRARQWVNLPRAAAETALTVTASSGERPARARLDWSAVAGREPRSVEVVFDGLPLAVDDPLAITLPEHDPSEVHSLRAELRFDGGTTSASELVFGGRFTDRATSEITAIPLIVEGRRKRLGAEGLAGWFLKEDTPLEVAAVDEGPADLIVVPDVGARAALNAIWRRAAWTDSAILSSPGLVDWEPRPSSGRDLRVEFLYPLAARQGPADSAFDLFPHSQKFVGDQARLPPLFFWILPPELKGTQRLADAVAAAGVAAAASRQRRAVLVLHSGSSPDASDIEPGVAREYLKALRVPLFVWDLRGALDAERGWGDAVAANDYGKMRLASNRLIKELYRQRMVWLVGHHLPQRVVLDRRAGRARLAGAGRDGRR